jgi:ABC-type uncharacterized transport system auxiliary subunit
MCRGPKLAAQPAVARPLGLVLALSLVLIAGCGAVSDPAPHRTFLVQLDPASASASPLHKPAAPVYVAPVVVAAPFSGRSLVVRQSEVGFEEDPYAEFAANPGPMWTEAVVGWLDARQLFERVLPLGTSADAALTLETNVLEAVIDRRPGQSATSRVTIRFILIRNDTPYQVLLDRTFTHAEPVKGGGADGEVAALSLAANHVLLDFEEALGQIQN